MTEAIDSSTQSEIVAKPSWDYRWRRLALVVVIFGYGLWSLYDGYDRMPAVNAEAQRLHPGIEILPYPGYDIPFNRYLGAALPPLSIVFLAWVLYASRGQYRFVGSTLSTPGHPDVNIKSIRKIDRSRWDRKGIALLHYQVPGSSKLSVIKLDDFIYDRKPTDFIFDLVEKSVDAARTAVAAPVAPARIICASCGTQNLPSATACSACGTKLS